MKRKIDVRIENLVVAITRYIHKNDLGVKTSELENAIRTVLQEVRDMKK